MPQPDMGRLSPFSFYSALRYDFVDLPDVDKHGFSHLGNSTSMSCIEGQVGRLRSESETHALVSCYDLTIH